MKEISQALRELEKIPNKKLLIFRGEGKGFCYGASVEEHLPERVREMLPKFNNFIAKLEAFFATLNDDTNTFEKFSQTGKRP